MQWLVPLPRLPGQPGLKMDMVKTSGQKNTPSGILTISPVECRFVLTYGYSTIHQMPLVYGDSTSYHMPLVVSKGPLHLHCTTADPARRLENPKIVWEFCGRLDKDHRVNITYKSTLQEL